MHTPHPQPDPELVLTSTAGALNGRRLQGHRDVAAFKGIPFAAPPVGPLRWRPPQPIDPWEGVRPASEIGPAPIQPQPLRSSIMWHTNFADRRALVMSEDCLHLNVWTPEPSRQAQLPVLVFLQGGGNRLGHGGQELHDGASLAARGIVVVTLNMRVGALGFLAHPELAAEDELGASGNYGVLDVAAALRWVSEHIESFGGDPTKVTFGGNSAGAAIVTHLMAAPTTKTLFRAALGQSASGIFRAEGPMASQADAQAEGLRALGDLAAAPLEQLRRLPATSLLLDAHLGVVVDGRLITRDTQEVFVEGGQADMPLLVGATSDEGANFTTPAAARALVERVTTGDRGAELATHYPITEDQLRASARSFVGETRFNYPVWRWARTHVATLGAPTWLYHFRHHPPLPDGIDLAPPPDGGPSYGAFHTAELPYTADNLGCRPWPWTDVDRTLARRCADLVARFVSNLDPNGADLPTWPPYDGTPDGLSLVLDETLTVERIPRTDALQLLDELERPL